MRRALLGELRGNERVRFVVSFFLLEKIGQVVSGAASRRVVEVIEDGLFQADDGAEETELHEELEEQVA